MKNCSQCKQQKPFAEFSPDKRTTTGRQSKCKVCMAKNRRIKHFENPEHHRRLVAESVQRNYQKKLNSNHNYRLNNPEKVAFWKQKDRQINKSRVNADNAMRRAKINTAITPEVKQIYALRDFYIAMSLGDKFHVDHVIPITKGGLHTIENLKVIPAICNLRKGAN
jgi:5-methylcytosine-specific restriction endonuclease McrA